jgi:hypothetical protein
LPWSALAWKTFPPATTSYLMAIIYGVGFFFSLFDFARHSLSVNGLSYLNVTNVIEAHKSPFVFWLECTSSEWCEEIYKFFCKIDMSVEWMVFVSSFHLFCSLSSFICSHSTCVIKYIHLLYIHNNNSPPPLCKKKFRIGEEKRKFRDGKGPHMEMLCVGVQQLNPD